MIIRPLWSVLTLMAGFGGWCCSVSSADLCGSRLSDPIDQPASVTCHLGFKRQVAQSIARYTVFMLNSYNLVDFLIIVQKFNTIQ